MSGHGYDAPTAGEGGWRGSSAAGSDGRGPSGALPYFQDIVATAQETVNSFRGASIIFQVDKAQAAFNSAKMMLQHSRRPDRAFLDYLIAFTVLTEVIPSNPRYIEFQSSRGPRYRQLQELTKEIRLYQERFEKIKDIIQNDNKRNGTQPIRRALARPSSRGVDNVSRNYRPVTPNGQMNNYDMSSIRHSLPSAPTPVSRDDELMLPQRPSLDVPTDYTNGRSSPSGSSDSHRSRPPVHPKPHNLHGRSLGSNGVPPSNGSVDPLMERFSRLRPTPQAIDTGNSPKAGAFSAQMPSPTEYTSSNRPSGPRDMPPPPSVPPPHPPKLPLNTQLAASMPKEPSPTYSPARNLSTPANINPPRSTARSMIGSGGRSNSLASSVPAYPPNTNGDTDSYFPSANNSQTTVPVRRKSIHVPRELDISAEKLYDYTRMHSVLLIDVRDREEFDEGHIYVNNIMCVEPTALEEGKSAEQLQDRLVLSPDEEQNMFERRNEYDLVVYYDESTASTAFLSRPPRNDQEVALKRLFDTLYEFNSDKPLQRPPILLIGGIHAWTDLLGSTALKTSNTAALVASGHTKPSRAIRRVPMARNGARPNIQRRRDYAPMDPEEERKLLEEARRDRPALERQSMDNIGEEETESPIYRTTDDFLRRYPDPAEIEHQSMIYPPSRKPVPNTYTTPAIPSVPSRPPPSVPRVSYSGVHERQVAPQGRVTQLPAYVSPSYHPQYRLPKTGLHNFGVTCYMNSTIQCLNATSPLTQLFLSNGYLKLIQRENWKGTRGLMSETFATLVQNLWGKDHRPIRPSSFRKICARFNSEWGIDRQQDAKEFLEFVLDSFHEDLNTVWAKPPLHQLTPADELAREALPRPYAAKIEWRRYTHREQSVVGDMFAGQHASQLSCTVCGTTSTTYEAFWSISVEIPKDRPADLRDCLRSYCAQERLSGDEVWKCPRCKVDREATKKLTITRAPEFLVIHFKRFSASHTERARKVRTPIEFPLHGLDLAPFTLPPLKPEEEDYIIAHANAGAHNLAELKADSAMNGPYVYNAYGVIRHMGNTLSSGHYTALVKDKGKGVWREFNDEKATDFDPTRSSTSSRLQNENAYIVFYERDKSPGGFF
ncbi:cysteine proteinase [Mytilinidion resinicola]|uniref:Cysteine proteinase n=1 Tax=Mytilinidion resinicola TaxID=574789 RepID=A0A6A6Y838_9PEZI|nr:cysteine proteinase [Mytilinidion resinicola]KAF2804718.1 cysteine proteinase [Mytilinidion resinicola]